MLTYWFVQSPLYPAYLPSKNVKETKETFPAWEVEEYVDPGSRGSPDFRNLLGLPGAGSFEVTPALGTEIRVGGGAREWGVGSGEKRLSLVGWFAGRATLHTLEGRVGRPRPPGRPPRHPHLVSRTQSVAPPRPDTTASFPSLLTRSQPGPILQRHRLRPPARRRPPLWPAPHPPDDAPPRGRAGDARRLPRSLGVVRQVSQPCVQIQTLVYAVGVRLLWRSRADATCRFSPARVQLLQEDGRAGEDQQLGVARGPHGRVAAAGDHLLHGSGRPSGQLVLVHQVHLGQAMLTSRLALRSADWRRHALRFPDRGLQPRTSLRRRLTMHFMARIRLTCSSLGVALGRVQEAARRALHVQLE